MDYVKEIKNKVREFKNSGSKKINRAHDEVNYRVRAKYINRWMELSGVDRPEEIDYNEPHVAIEWLLCDPVNLKLIRSRNPKDRQRVYDLMTPEMQDVYFNEVDEHGARYCDLEGASLVKSLRQTR